MSTPETTLEILANPTTEEVVVPSWPQPKGYSNGRIGTGRTLHVGGQIGWTTEGKFVESELPGQFAQTLDNVLAVVRAAGGMPEDIAAMTVFVTDVPRYRSAQRELGAIWRERMGTHYPAMALVGVTELVEREACVEIQAVAYLGDRV